MKGLIIAALMFAAVAFARYKIFELDDKPTPKTYDKPVWIQQLVMPKDALPENYQKTGDTPLPVKMDAAISAVPKLANAAFPQPGDVDKVLVQRFVSSSGLKVAAVTVHYKPKDILERIGVDRFKPPRYHAVDQCLTWFDADDEDAVKLFHDAFAQYAERAKKARVSLEKSLVLSNAALKFFADLLVGAFGFILALFFTKYFLVIQPTEK